MNGDLIVQALGSCLSLVSPLAVITTANAFMSKIDDPSNFSVLLPFDGMLLYCQWLPF